ncbi:hypothetical protein J4032_17110 [Streptomyces formicae]|uniref:Terpene synthase n=1 Tax=Streptomyces formicae TaxID=1616117 RepID=A0ABY3WMW5_9ACTN|nr:terpene synthase family protein [Streptomyces formicae]UNM13005.1 hypothetical protein J4032_17110 [Streptomyces formicae]
MDDLNARVTAAATDWAITRPHIQIPRVAPLARLLATAAPFADAEALTTQARATLWVFAVDDFFDSRTTSMPELRRFTASCTATLAGRHPDSSATPLSDGLAEIRDEVAQYQLFARLADLWNDGVLQVLRGMLDEARWAHEYRTRGPTALPDLTRYLHSAYRSIGGPAHFRTVFATLGDASTPHCVPSLLRLEKEASLVVRLANDLRSQAKETQEGTVNAVLILQQQALARGLPASAALRAARQTVGHQLAHHLTRCQELSRHPVTATGRLESVLSTTAALAAAFYRDGDFLPASDE